MSAPTAREWVVGADGPTARAARPPARPVDPDAPIYVISVAARLAGLHPQTLRQYDRLGLVSPGRSAGRARRYSLTDIALLREVGRLTAQGVNLAGVKRIIELTHAVEEQRRRAAAAEAQLSALLDLADQHRRASPARRAELVPARPAYPLVRAR